ncbi:MAG: AAA family ATPase [Chloroflexi bacterium]|nr:AAA family ATPase [Chloroflexota bacterium]
MDLGRTCVLVTGAPGAGKSTVTRRLAAALTRSAVLDGYVISRLIVSGHVWALGEPADEASRQGALCNDNLCALATNIANAGFTPLIDTVVPDRAQLDTYRQSLGDRLRLVVLDPDIGTCVQRNAMRPASDQFFFDGYAELRASMQNGFHELGWWFDTSTLTIDETVKQLLEAAGDRAVLLS